MAFEIRQTLLSRAARWICHVAHEALDRDFGSSKETHSKGVGFSLCARHVVYLGGESPLWAKIGPILIKESGL
jgi:hypothetical protein